MYCEFGGRDCPYCNSTDNSFRPECFMICSMKLSMNDDSIFKVVESWYSREGSTDITELLD